MSPQDYLVAYFCITRRIWCDEAKPVRASFSKTVPKIVSCPVYSTWRWWTGPCWKQFIPKRAKGLFGTPEIQLKTAYPRQSQRFVCSTWDPVESSLSKLQGRAKGLFPVWFIARTVTKWTLLKTDDLFAAPEIQLKTAHPRQSQRFVSCLVYSTWDDGQDSVLETADARQSRRLVSSPV